MTEQISSLRAETTNKFRLPKDVIPERYEIKLVPDVDAGKFTGEETITIEVRVPKHEILLNAIELGVTEAKLVDAKGRTYSAAIEFLVEDERLRLSFENQIEPGKHLLHLKFSGFVNDKLCGFYRSKFFDVTGTEKYLATSQMEATDARRAFPCWDEPDFKAVFSIALTADRSLMVISNAGIKSEEELPNNKKLVRFKDTIKMSTYLVAFIIGPFASTEPTIVNGVTIRILTLPQKLNLAKFAIGIAAHSISYFEAYYGVKYPGDKLDLIAIPDFAFGAMENLGAVTFRETALLVDEETASHAELERVADVVSHEIAHMWFGDLTTMKWWNGIWLNEAFATFMEMLAEDSWKPEWKRWDSFGVSRAQALATDGLRSTRSIEFPVGRPEEANAMFDVLTYEKGASVLRMLEQYIGPKVFQKGISSYLQKFQCANTETEDLWAALTDASKQPVGEIMKPWIFGQGHPLVKVEAISARRYRVSQQRFFYLKEARDESLFEIPLILKAQVGSEILERKILLGTRQEEIEFPGDVDWLLANSGGHGFYRVLYSNFENLARAEVFRKLETIERFNLVSDSWALAQAGELPLKQYFHLISLLIDERDKNVWTIVTGSLKYLWRMVDPGQIGYLREFTQGLLRPVLDKLGWPEVHASADKHRDVDQVRAQLIDVLGTFGNAEDVRARAAAYFEKYQDDKFSVNAELVPAIINIVGYSGGPSTYDHYVEVFKQTSIPQEQDRYMYALANFQSEEMLHRTLEMAVDGTVRSQNAPFLIRAVMLNRSGRAMAWQFVKDNWSRMPLLYPTALLVRMLEGITGLVSRSWLDDTREFFKDKDIPTGQKTLDQYLEKQHVAVVMKERESKILSSPWG
jgi:puromycin-sensitive aminopeptidase